MSHKLIGSVVLDGPTLAASIADRLLNALKKDKSPKQLNMHFDFPRSCLDFSVWDGFVHQLAC